MVFLFLWLSLFFRCFGERLFFIGVCFTLLFFGLAELLLIFLFFFLLAFSSFRFLAHELGQCSSFCFVSTLAEFRISFFFAFILHFCIFASCAGHNFGSHHAQNYQPASTVDPFEPLAGGGVVRDYGDDYDVMGGGECISSRLFSLSFLSFRLFCLDALILCLAASLHFLFFFVGDFGLQCQFGAYEKVAKLGFLPSSSISTLSVSSMELQTKIYPIDAFVASVRTALSLFFSFLCISCFCRFSGF
jgi:hypothetical protein